MNSLFEDSDWDSFKMIPNLSIPPYCPNNVIWDGTKDCSAKKTRTYLSNGFQMKMP